MNQFINLPQIFIVWFIWIVWFSRQSWVEFVEFPIAMKVLKITDPLNRRFHGTYILYKIIYITLWVIS